MDSTSRVLLWTEASKFVPEPMRLLPIGAVMQAPHTPLTHYYGSRHVELGIFSEYRACKPGD